MNKKELIENFLDYRSFRIPWQDLDIARYHLGLLIDSIREECAKIVIDYKDILLENRKEIAKAIRDKE